MADIEVNLENEEWKQYKVQFNKTYADEKEEIDRYKLFIGTKKTIEEHNEKYKKGEVTFEMGINQFADRRTDEVVCCGVRKKN